MSDPFIGEIRYLPYSFAPLGWFPCDGKQYPIQQYPALFSILGTTFGGDGKTTFGVPNLMPPLQQLNTTGPAVAGLGTAPGSGTTINYGKTIGSSDVTLSTSNVPSHTHQLSRKSPTNATDLTTRTTTPNAFADVGALGKVSGSTATYLYMLSSATPPDTTLHPSTLSPSGGAANGTVLSHENRQPCLTFLPAIAWDGVYPVSD